jgi:uncharacterized protein (DUF1800 family)
MYVQQHIPPPPPPEGWVGQTQTWMSAYASILRIPQVT